MSEGAILIHRKMMHSAIWSCSHGTFIGFITCLLMANWQDQKWYSKAEKKEVLIPRGSFFTTMELFSKRSNLSSKGTRLCWDTLINLGITTQRRTRHGTYITVLNYDKYQLKGAHRRAQDRANQGHTEGTQRGMVRSKTSEEIKEREEGSTAPPSFSLSEYVNGWKQKPEHERKENAAAIAEGLKKFKLGYRVEEDLYQQIMGENENGTIRSKSIFEQAAERHGKGGLKKTGGETPQWEVLARLRDLPKVSPKTGLIDGGRGQSDDKPI